ncbi:major intracellular serine protease [Salinibacillus kushneri]|uniref:Major intracellular serine protease n=1 Tax=Salinibacillus kushneri TaxID=237682 RepID=A0A1I0DY59_9BACI|nr:S8 family peptidase [Salinibacillus kushneri]SET37198.1 major intracellular serine protease [Salinibacillus kushneri]
MLEQVRLIDYQVMEQLDETNEVPKGVRLIKASEVWGKSKGRDQTIAVLDTGCADHRDLNQNIIGGRNFTTDDNGNPEIFEDYNGHGTHVAGTIAAAENGDGVIGVAPESKLLILKVLNENGSGQYDWIIEGIHYAIEQNVDIISMSLGGPEDIPELHDAIKKAVNHDISVVCAAGNEGDGDDTTRERSYPGSYNEVISVGAVNLQRESSEFTNSNKQVDLVGPGEQITSTYLDGQYATLSGTSMATPHITGSLALIKSIETNNFERNLTEAELYAQLIKRTVPLGFSPKLEGNGLIYLPLLDYIQGVYDDLNVQIRKPLPN